MSVLVAMSARAPGFDGLGEEGGRTKKSGGLCCGVFVEIMVH